MRSLPVAQRSRFPSGGLTASLTLTVGQRRRWGRRPLQAAPVWASGQQPQQLLQEPDWLVTVEGAGLLLRDLLVLDLVVAGLRETHRRRVRAAPEGSTPSLTSDL